MIIVQNVLISEDIIKEYFHCNLNVCKGACCIEGDYGAPLLDEEIEIIDKILHIIQPLLDEDSAKFTHEHGYLEYHAEAGTNVTKCLDSGACVFLQKSLNGIGKCSFEVAWLSGITSFQKPLSCHLYPIRVSFNEITGFEIWNYDRWHICNSACSLGADNRIAVYEFLKDAIIRYKGHEFYEELDAVAKANLV